MVKYLRDPLSSLLTSLETQEKFAAVLWRKFGEKRDIVIFHP